MEDKKRPGNNPTGCSAGMPCEGGQEARPSCFDAKQNSHLLCLDSPHAGSQILITIKN